MDDSRTHGYERSGHHYDLGDGKRASAQHGVDYRRNIDKGGSGRARFIGDVDDPRRSRLERGRIDGLRIWIDNDWIGA